MLSDLSLDESPVGRLAHQELSGRCVGMTRVRFMMVRYEAL